MSSGIRSEPFWIADITENQKAFSRRGFCGYGRYWFFHFYYDTCDFLYASSQDGFVWKMDDLYTILVPKSQSNYFSIFFDGTHVHYVRYDGYGSERKVYYRKGQPDFDGTITWLADEQLIFSSSDTSFNPHPNVAVDSEGYAWVILSTSNTNGYPRVFKNKRKDGIWENDTGFPFNLSNTSGSWDTIGIAPLKDGKVMCLYNLSGTMYYRIWNGAGWEDPGQVTSSFTYSSFTSDLNYVYLVWYYGGNLYYKEYSLASNSWNAEKIWDVGSVNTEGISISKLWMAREVIVFWISQQSGKEGIWWAIKSFKGDWSKPTQFKEKFTYTTLSSFYNAYGGRNALFLVNPNDVDGVPTLSIMIFREAPAISLWEGPITTDHTWGYAGTYESFQRKCFYAHGRWWYFYYLLETEPYGEVCYRTFDGHEVSPKVTIKSGLSPYLWGSILSLYFDGTKVYFVLQPDESSIQYACAIPNPDGTLTWVCNWTTVVTGLSDIYSPTITKDTDGYVWIAYKNYITRSGNNDGTWGSTPPGYPDLVFLEVDHSCIVPLSSGRVGIIGVRHNFAIWLSIWVKDYEVDFYGSGDKYNSSLFTAVGLLSLVYICVWNNRTSEIDFIRYSQYSVEKWKKVGSFPDFNTQALSLSIIFENIHSYGLRLFVMTNEDNTYKIYLRDFTNNLSISRRTEIYERYDPSYWVFEMWSMTSPDLLTSENQLFAIISGEAWTFFYTYFFSRTALSAKQLKRAYGPPILPYISR